MSRRKKTNFGIPNYEIESLARVLLPTMRAYLNSEEGKREFAAWQAERQQKQLNKKLNNKNESH